MKGKRKQAVEKLILSKTAAEPAAIGVAALHFKRIFIDFLMRECEKKECAVFFNSLEKHETQRHEDAKKS